MSITFHEMRGHALEITYFPLDEHQINLQAIVNHIRIQTSQILAVGSFFAE